MKGFLIPVSALTLVFLGTAFAATQATPTQATNLPDLANASQVEVRAAGGAVVLAGQFAAATTEDGETEREATLTAAGDVSGATGTAEIEITSRGNQTAVEFELDVMGLPANTTFSVVIDGQIAATFTTDADGEAEIELKDVKAS